MLDICGPAPDGTAHRLSGMQASNEAFTCDVVDNDLLNVVSFDFHWRIAFPAHSASQIRCYDPKACLNERTNLQVGRS